MSLQHRDLRSGMNIPAAHFGTFSAPNMASGRGSRGAGKRYRSGAGKRGRSDNGPPILTIPTPRRFLVRPAFSSQRNEPDVLRLRRQCAEPGRPPEPDHQLRLQCTQLAHGHDRPLEPPAHDVVRCGKSSDSKLGHGRCGHQLCL
jgi:hypothetical protein